MRYVYIKPSTSSTIAVVENVPEPIECETSESRPSSTIKWMKNEVFEYDCDTSEMILVQNNLVVTKCTSLFTINRQNGSWTLSCTAFNAVGSSAVEANSSKVFSVLCKYNLKN